MAEPIKNSTAEYASPIKKLEKDISAATGKDDKWMEAGKSLVGYAKAWEMMSAGIDDFEEAVLTYAAWEMIENGKTSADLSDYGLYKGAMDLLNERGLAAPARPREHARSAPAPASAPGADEIEALKEEMEDLRKELDDTKTYWENKYNNDLEDAKLKASSAEQKAREAESAVRIVQAEYETSKITHKNDIKNLNEMMYQIYLDGEAELAAEIEKRQASKPPEGPKPEEKPSGGAEKGEKEELEYSEEAMADVQTALDDLKARMEKYKGTEWALQAAAYLDTAQINFENGEYDDVIKKAADFDAYMKDLEKPLVEDKKDLEGLEEFEVVEREEGAEPTPEEGAPTDYDAEAIMPERTYEEIILGKAEPGEPRIVAELDTKTGKWKNVGGEGKSGPGAGVSYSKETPATPTPVTGPSPKSPEKKRIKSAVGFKLRDGKAEIDVIYVGPDMRRVRATTEELLKRSGVVASSDSEIKTDGDKLLMSIDGSYDQKNEQKVRETLEELKGVVEAEERPPEKKRKTFAEGFMSAGKGDGYA